MSASTDVDTRLTWDPGPTATVPVYAFSSQMPDSTIASLLVEFSIISINLIVADISCNALLDSCSAVNLVSHDFLSSLPAHYRNRFNPDSSISRRTTLVAFDGTTTVRPDGHVQLPVRLGDSDQRELVFLVSKLAAHSVL